MTPYDSQKLISSVVATAGTVLGVIGIVVLLSQSGWDHFIPVAAMLFILLLVVVLVPFTDVRVVCIIVGFVSLLIGVCLSTYLFSDSIVLRDRVVQQLNMGRFPIII